MTLCVIASSISAQGVDSVEVTPHKVTRAVTENIGTGTGSCQHFWPWAYDAAGNRVHRQTFVWSLSNPNDFTVEDGGVCARQTQLSDTVTTTVTATIEGTQVSGTASFTVTPDPALAPAPVAATPPPPPPNVPGTAGAPTAAGQPQAGEAVMDTTIPAAGPGSDQRDRHSDLAHHVADCVGSRSGGVGVPPLSVAQRRRDVHCRQR